jgi:hypothetical protein
VTVTSSHIKEDLRESRDRLFSSIRGLSEEQFRHVQTDKTWSIAAHLAHLLRIERVYAERALAALTEVEPFVSSTRVHNDDDPGLSQRLAVPQIIHGMLNTRRDLQAVLDGCDEAGLQRVVRHETLGRLTIQQMMEKMAGHEAEHALEIAHLVKQAPASARIPASGPQGVTIPLARRS